MKKDNWIIKVFFLTFIIALIFNSVSNVLIDKFNNLVLLLLIELFFILLGIIFDIIGTAALTAEESTFHAKSAKKIIGAKEAVYIIKNGSSFSSICNDVIGDICGIVCGSISAMIGIVLSYKLNISSVITILVFSSIISSITVGGKAIGKKYAVKNSDKIIFVVAKIFSKFKRCN